MFADAENLPVEAQLPFLKARLAELDAEDRTLAEQLVLGFLSLRARGVVIDRDVVVFIHGIRTHAPWQDVAEDEVRKIPNAVAMSFGYDYFDVLRFWLPGIFRRRPIERSLQYLRDAQAQYPAARMSVVAHSFGSYVLSRILIKNPDVRPNRVLLCGSIIPTNYRWDQVPCGLSRERVVNEVGTRDLWPVVAKAVSWGYGASGSFGCKNPRVSDRFHDLDHSGFLKRTHIRKYWIPFLSTGSIVRGEWPEGPPVPPWYVSVLAIFPFKFAVFLVLVSVLLYVLGGEYLF